MQILGLTEVMCKDDGDFTSDADRIMVIRLRAKPELKTCADVARHAGLASLYGGLDNCQNIGSSWKCGWWSKDLGESNEGHKVCRWQATGIRHYWWAAENNGGTEQNIRRMRHEDKKKERKVTRLSKYKGKRITILSWIQQTLSKPASSFIVEV